LALSGHAYRVGRCPLSGAKQTLLKDGIVSACDPQLPIDGEFCCGAQRTS
jgi:hypothetical protein